MTAISLAAQLYRFDRGTWPGKLEDLVPSYLPAVPTDPFCDCGRKVGYVIAKGKLPGGGDRPLVFVDAGEDVGYYEEPMFGWQQDQRPPGQRKEDIRQYRDLSRFIPKPSAETVNDNPQKPNRPGK